MVDWNEIIGNGYVDSIIKSLKDGETENALKVSQELLDHNNDPDMSNDVVDSIKMYLKSELVDLLDDTLKNNTLDDNTLDCLKEIAKGNGVDMYKDYKTEHVQTLSDKIGQYEKTIKKNSESNENIVDLGKAVVLPVQPRQTKTEQSTRLKELADKVDECRSAEGDRLQDIAATTTPENTSAKNLGMKKGGRAG
ncbi:MAG: hypothetical protein VXZ73_02125 [Pseudomonadota bacterium]|nr:hypothetical protein [Pseudomonadota bacterium]